MIKRCILAIVIKTKMKMKQICFKDNIVKKVRSTRELWGDIKYEKLLLAVLVGQRSIFIKLMDALINQLRNNDENFSINFHFTHDISKTKEQDFAEVEIVYPLNYSEIIKECCNLATKTISELNAIESDLLEQSKLAFTNRRNSYFS